MSIVAKLLVGLVGLAHLGFLYMEMFRWEGVGKRLAGLDAETLAKTAALGQNQGLYNGFLAAGLLWAAFAGRVDLAVFFLGCVIVAGAFGAATLPSRATLWMQALPGAVALAAVLFLKA